MVVRFCPGTKLEALETKNSPSPGSLLRPCPSEVILYFVYPGQKEMVTPVILSSVILATAMLQLYTELKAQSSMEALRSLQVGESVQVTRTDSGQRSDLSISPEELVTGDIIFLEAGCRIPADVRILHCSNLEVDNSALTGETIPDMRTSKAEPATIVSTEACRIEVRRSKDEVKLSEKSIQLVQRISAMGCMQSVGICTYCNRMRVYNRKPEDGVGPFCFLKEF